MKQLCSILLGLSLILSLMFTGCSVLSDPDAEVVNADQTATLAADNQTAAVQPGQVEVSELFSDRDLSGEYDAAEAVTITLNGDTAVCDSAAVNVSDGAVTISGAGTYILSGTLNDGYIAVNAAKTEKVQLVLDGVHIFSQSFAPIYVAEADKVFVTLAQGSQNTLENGGGFTQIDTNNVDAVIFSKDDLTLNGTGTLTVVSPAGHGIVGKDEVVVTGGSYTVTASSQAIVGKDSLSISDGAFTLTAGKDGLHSENEDDASLGNVYLGGGSYTITAAGDEIGRAHV